MSKLLDLQQKLDSTNAAIVETESQLLAHPDIASALTLNLKSLVKRRDNLEEQFLHCAAVEKVDVFDYRLLMSEFAKAIHLADAITTFQTVVTQFYASLREKKARNHMGTSNEIKNATQFNYAYGYGGSVGLVLTLTNEQLLLGGTFLDQAIKLAFDVAQAKSPEVISEYSKTLGSAPIRALYIWAETLSKAEFGAAMNWRREETIMAELVIQPPQLAQLKEFIAVTGEPTVEEFDAVGSLEAVDHTQKTAKLKLANNSILFGSLSEQANLQHLVTHDIYDAHVTKTTTIKFATDEHVVEYRFQTLVPRNLPPSP